MKYSLLVVFLLSIWACGSKTPRNVQSARFVLSIQLPESRYIHQAEFSFPNTLRIAQRNFLVGDDSTVRSVSFQLSAEEVNNLLAVGQEVFDTDTQPHYGFEEEGERTALMYELDLALNGVVKNILVYNPHKGMKLPAPLSKYMKEMSRLMSQHEL